MQATFGPLESSFTRCSQTRCHSKERPKTLHLISLRRVSSPFQISLTRMPKILFKSFLFWNLKRDLELKTLMTWHLIHSLMASISIPFQIKLLQLAKMLSLNSLRPRKNKWITCQSTSKRQRLVCNNKALLLQLIALALFYLLHLLWWNTIQVLKLQMSVYSTWTIDKMKTS